MSDGDGSSDAETATRSARAEESPASGGTDAVSEEPAADEAGTPETRGAEASAPAPTEIDVGDLVGPERRLDPKVRYVWVLQAAISSLIFGVMVGLPAFLVFERPFVGPAVFFLVFTVGATLAVFRYRRWSYQVREDSLFLDRGVVTQTRTVVPYVRIQHVDASRGPVERAFGLATAVVYTAGSRGADVSIPGLTPERADDLQDRLKRLAIAAEGEDAV
ncbi:PH domain-containing protein [Salinirubellus salinus]|uniref:PH domain-containing protein n=1 Tax=Salinirubellus salinus TaxID=1364945 RepID=A0A9E7U5X8_9EURY|nr:PH domain-containing protein [Salinirubellus salinus]UWM55890.1 PH domain-containing protein [Salinirubellus salinus]